MSIVEDVRKVIQDLVAPDLKAIQAQLAGAEKLASARHELMLAELKTFQAINEARHESIMRSLDVDRRRERLESARTQEQKVTSEPAAAVAWEPEVTAR